LTQVKICGITRDEDLEAVIDTGADAVGFVVGVPSSPRNLSPERASELVKQVPVFTKTVMVMVPQGLKEITKAYEAVKPDALQLHGEGAPNADEIRAVISGADLIRGVTLNPGEVQSDVQEAEFFDAVLLDTFVPGVYGGTGITHDWETARELCHITGHNRLILAGGLNPSNVQKAIRKVRPYAVDVSTGVESSPGVKDPRKIEFFIKQVRKMEP
jgi:phosphoribosylanthranilate isomerase